MSQAGCQRFLSAGTGLSREEGQGTGGWRGLSLPKLRNKFPARPKASLPVALSALKASGPGDCTLTTDTEHFPGTFRGTHSDKDLGLDLGSVVF